MSRCIRLIGLAMLLLPLTACGQIVVQGRVSTSGNVQATGGTLYLEATPPMGWNSWLAASQQYYPQSNAWLPTEAYIEQQSNALVSTGLQALGYNLMSIDAGWGQRDGGGNLQAVPSQFPGGVTGLAAFIHKNHQRLGLYGTPGDPCVANSETQYGHELADAKQLAAWKVDYFKYDLCNANNQYPTDAGLQGGFALMGNALAYSGYPISMVVNAYQSFTGIPAYLPYHSINWYQKAQGNSLRIGNDNDGPGGVWYSKAFGLDWTQFAPYQRKGSWLDMDALIMQLKECNATDTNYPCDTNVVGDVEARSQFNFYAITAEPLIIGARITDLTPASLQTLSNAEVIAVDQDQLGVMGYRVSSTACGSVQCQVWVRQTTTGYAVAFFNADPSAAHTLSVTWSQFGQSGTFNIRDLWAHSSVGSSATGYTPPSIPAWGSVMVAISR